MASSSSYSSTKKTPLDTTLNTTLKQMTLKQEIQKFEKEKCCSFTPKELETIYKIDSSKDGSEVLIQANIQHMDNNIKEYTRLQGEIQKFHNRLLLLTKINKTVTEDESKWFLNNKKKLDERIKGEDDKYTSYIDSLKLESKQIKESPNKDELEERVENMKNSYKSFVESLKLFEKLYNTHIESI